MLDQLLKWTGTHPPKLYNHEAAKWLTETPPRPPVGQQLGWRTSYDGASLTVKVNSESRVISVWDRFCGSPPDCSDDVTA